MSRLIVNKRRYALRAGLLSANAVTLRSRLIITNAPARYHCTGQGHCNLK